MQLISLLLLTVIGLGSGLVVGAGFIAFITVLDIIPRAIQMTNTRGFLYHYQMVLVAGAVLGSLVPELGISFGLPVVIAVVVGWFMGIYVGFFVAALTEVINVLPIVARRLKIKREIAYLFTALSLGKALGSLVYWLFPNLWQY